MPLIPLWLSYSQCYVYSLSMLVPGVLCGNLVKKELIYSGMWNMQYKHRTDIVLYCYILPNKCFIKLAQTSWHTVSLEFWNPWNSGVPGSHLLCMVGNQALSRLQIYWCMMQNYTTRKYVIYFTQARGWLSWVSFYLSNTLVLSKS